MPYKNLQNRSEETESKSKEEERKSDSHIQYDRHNAETDAMHQREKRLKSVINKKFAGTADAEIKTEQATKKLCQKKKPSAKKECKSNLRIFGGLHDTEIYDPVFEYIHTIL